uniref:Nicastrin n=1 Tax=Gasterosteus aculeatus aculeatus TaxID=481459 RepID=G3Q0Q5_GASAC
CPVGVGCSSVEKKIYVHLNYTLPCVRLLNATHQIGCQSHLSGNVGVLHVLESEENLDWVLRSGLNPPYLVILDSPLFTRSIMMKLKNGSSRVAGVAVVAPSTNPPDGVSPHTNCPNENTGVYTEKYDPALAHCNVTVWNPLGSGLSYEEFDFPIFSLKDDNDTKVIRQETFDYIGSSRMVYDMEKKHFVVDLDNIHSLLEIGQVGLRVNSSLWLHSDPVSRKNSSVDGEVKKLLESLRAGAAGLNVSLAEPSFSQPLPPSSFQRFLRARPIPGVVIQDHQSSFTNRFYESMYDNAGYLDISYPPDLTPEQQLQFVTDTATALTEVATVVARSLYAQAGGDQARLSSINADPQMVTQMLYGFLVRSNNSWFQQLVPSNLMSFLADRPTNLYVGVLNQHSELTMLVQHLLANLTGTTVNITQENCNYQREDEQDKMLTLGVGLGVLITSLLLTYAMSAKADILFSSGREPVNATY